MDKVQRIGAEGRDEREGGSKEESEGRDKRRMSAARRQLPELAASPAQTFHPGLIRGRGRRERRTLRRCTSAGLRLYLLWPAEEELGPADDGSGEGDLEVDGPPLAGLGESDMLEDVC